VDALCRRDEDSDRAHALALYAPEFAIFDDFKKEADTLQDIVDKRREIADGTASAAWSMVDGFVMHRGRVFVPSASSLLPQLLGTAHSTGHEGAQKMLHRLRATYNPHTSRLVRDYVKGCDVCQRNKTEHLQQDFYSLLISEARCGRT